MLGCHRLGRPALTIPQVYKQFGHQVVWLVAQRQSFQHGFRRGDLPRNLIQQRGGERFHERFDGAGLGRKTFQNAANPRVVTRSQVRQKLVSQAIASVTRVVVGVIVAKRLPQRLQVPDHLAAGNRQHRTDQRCRGGETANPGDARQSGESRAAQQAMQDRLALVVRGVGKGHVSRAVTVSRSQEKIQSASTEPIFVLRWTRRKTSGRRSPGYVIGGSGPGRRFVVSVRFVVRVRFERFARSGSGSPSAELAGESEFFRQFTNELRVGIRQFPTQTMVVVGHYESTGGCWFELLHGMQGTDEGDTVGSSRNANDDREIAPA